MPRSNGKVMQQVNKNSLPNPTTSVIQEKVTSVKRKITASTSTAVTKKTKQNLHYPNRHFGSPSSGAARDEATPMNIAASDEVVPRTFKIVQNLTQEKDKPLKSEELKDIKTTIRNWKPPLLRKKHEGNPTDDTEKPKDAVKQSHQKAVQKDGQQSGHVDLVGKYLTSREATLNMKPIANAQLAVSPGLGNVLAANKVTPLFTPNVCSTQLGPSTEEHVDDDTDQELIIEDSQLEMKTSTNLSLKTKISQQEKVIDLTNTQIKGSHSQNIDLFHGMMEICAETRDNADIDLTGSQREVTLEHNMEEEAETYSDPCNSLKSTTLANKNIHAAMNSQLDNYKLQLVPPIDILNESQHCDVTDTLLATPEREATCTPINCLSLQDLTPPTITRTHRNNPGGEERSSFYVCDLTDDSFHTPSRTKKTPCFEESPTLFPDTDSDQDFEQPTRKRESQDGSKSPSLDVCGDQHKIVNKFSTAVTVSAENGIEDTEDVGNEELLVSSPGHFVVKVRNHLSHNESDNTHTQTNNCVSTSNKENEKCLSVSNNARSQSKSTNCVPTADNPSHTSQKDSVCLQSKGIDCVPVTYKTSQKSRSESNNVRPQSKSASCVPIADNASHTSQKYSVHSQIGSIDCVPVTYKTSHKSRSESNNVRPHSKSASCLPIADNASHTSQKDSVYSQIGSIDCVPVTYKTSQKSRSESNNVHQQSKSASCVPIADNASWTSQKDNVHSQSESIGCIPVTYKTSQKSPSESNNVSSQSKSASCMPTSDNASNDSFDISKGLRILPPKDPCRKTPNKPDNILVHDNNVQQHALQLTPHSEASQNSRSKTKNSSTPTTEDLPSANIIIPTTETGSDNVSTSSNDIKQCTGGLLSDLNDGSQTPQHMSKNTSACTKEHLVPAKSYGIMSPKNTSACTQEHLVPAKSYGIISQHELDNTSELLSSDRNNGKQSHHTSQNGSNNTSVPMKDLEELVLPIKTTSQTDTSEPDKIVSNANAKGDQESYFHEMDQDFELISSSQLLAIEDELKQEMLKESVYNAGSCIPPSEGQTAPRIIPTACGEARVPVFRIPTIPPLQPFDWVQKVRDDRQKLRSIVQEMVKLNEMITKVRQDMWPGRRTDDSSGRRPDDGFSGRMFPPPPAGPSRRPNDGCSGGMFPTPTAGPSRRPDDRSSGGMFLPPTAGPSRIPDDRSSGGTFPPPPAGPGRRLDDGSSGRMFPPPPAGPGTSSATWQSGGWGQGHTRY